jgi:hypothetical protein
LFSSCKRRSLQVLGCLPRRYKAGLPRGTGGGGAGSLEPVALTPPESWNQAEGERSLAELKALANRARRQAFGGQFPVPLENVVTDILAIGKGYVTHPEEEWRRGWDPLALLRGLHGLLSDILAREKRCQACPYYVSPPCAKNLRVFHQ